jgi:hypothetical protein
MNTVRLGRKPDAWQTETRVVDHSFLWSAGIAASPTNAVRRTIVLCRPLAGDSQQFLNAVDVAGRRVPHMHSDEKPACTRGADHRLPWPARLRSWRWFFKGVDIAGRRPMACVAHKDSDEKPVCPCGADHRLPWSARLRSSRRFFETARRQSRPKSSCAAKILAVISTSEERAKIEVAAGCRHPADDERRSSVVR